MKYAYSKGWSKFKLRNPLLSSSSTTTIASKSIENEFANRLSIITIDGNDIELNPIHRIEDTNNSSQYHQSSWNNDNNNNSNVRNPSKDSSNYDSNDYSDRFSIITVEKNPIVHRIGENNCK